MSLSEDKDAEIIEAFNSRCLDDMLNIDYTRYFDSIINQIYPSEAQLNKANSSDTKARFKIYIWLLQMVLFLQKFMINLMILILIL